MKRLLTSILACVSIAAATGCATDQPSSPQPRVIVLKPKPTPIPTYGPVPVAMPVKPQEVIIHVQHDYPTTLTASTSKTKHTKAHKHRSSASIQEPGGSLSKQNLSHGGILLEPTPDGVPCVVGTPTWVIHSDAESQSAR